MKKFKLLHCFTVTAVLLAHAAVAQEEAKIQNIRVLLNDGSKYTNQATVSIKVEAMGARHIMLNTTGQFAGQEWKEFSPDIGQIDLGEQEGEKKVFVKLKDKYGNETPVIEQNIYFDKTPPKNPSVEINAEGGFVNNPDRIVTLEIKADDAKYMMVSNNPTFRETRWQGYRPSLPNWKLEGTNEGLKKVFVKFRDAAGNESDAAQDEILVDTQPPIDAKLSINNDAKVSADPKGQVQVSIFVRGGNDMKVSEQRDLKDAQWQPYKTNLDWKFEGQGRKILYVRFRDQAQNESETVGDDIIVDSQPPYDCNVLINNGAKYAENIDKFVELKLTAKEAMFMMISNSLDFSAARWEPYREVVPKWKLIGENGEKTVFVKFKDENGNETAVYKATIILAI